MLDRLDGRGENYDNRPGDDVPSVVPGHVLDAKHERWRILHADIPTPFHLTPAVRVGTPEFPTVASGIAEVRRLWPAVEDSWCEVLIVRAARWI